MGRLGLKPQLGRGFGPASVVSIAAMNQFKLRAAAAHSRLNLSSVRVPALGVEICHAARSRDEIVADCRRGGVCALDERRLDHRAVFLSEAAP